VFSERQKAMKAPSFRYTPPQLSFQKHNGLYFKDFSLKKITTFNTLVDVEYMRNLLVDSNYFLVRSFTEKSAVVRMYYLMIQSLAKTIQHGER